MMPATMPRMAGVETPELPELPEDDEPSDEPTALLLYVLQTLYQQLFESRYQVRVSVSPQRTATGSEQEPRVV